jgi:hypothetical protein
LDSVVSGLAGPGSRTYNTDVSVHTAFAVLSIALGAAVYGQTPQPFPRPTDTQKPGAPPAPGPAIPVAQPAPPPASGVPTEATLGIAIYPGAQYITSYDAGRGQRYYLFGTNATFNEIVNYYRSVLKQKGELVFDTPATHMFEVGRFREETMAFPPGVTVKDYTWGGSEGYPNPKPGAPPVRFKTVIQIVPAPSPAAAR